MLPKSWLTKALLLKILVVAGSYAFIVIPLQYCYGEIGCIVVDNDFYHPIRRPWNPTPSSRAALQVTYTVHSQEDTTGTLFSALEPYNIRQTSFKADMKTKILIHGYLDAEGEAWYPDMVKALLDFGDFNIITVNWGGGSRALYTQAAINTRMVGVEVAFLVNWLMTHENLWAKDVHIIGHSLGAHIAGYAGERIIGLSRISGLDPAESFFQGLPPRVRLDPSDAAFVDVIHTDSDPIYFLGLGLEEPVGHVDFYPNDGRRQPGCQHPISATFTTITQGFDFLNGLTPEQKVSVTCSHSRSVQLFTDSMVATQCNYDAFECSSYEKFLYGSCSACGADGTQCAQLGIQADQWSGVGLPNKENIKMYLQTGSGPKNYCL